MTVSSISPKIASLATSVLAERGDATGKAAAAGDDFAATLEGLVGDTGDTKSEPAFSPQLAPLVAHNSRKASPLEQFEGFVLRSFVESMLPSESSGFFGSGTAGSVWKSMLAEQIGDEIAKDGGIGIADAIAAKEKLSGSSSTGAAISGGLNALLARSDVVRAGTIADTSDE